ncbi:MAG: TorD/DmsD family molecular chaperone [Chloroflexota bacterium]
MAPVEAARARHHSYALLSRLFLDGLTSDLLSTLQQIAALAALLPSSIDADEAAATHYDLFGLNVFPYEAAFLDSGPRGSAIQLGGPVTQRVQQQMQASNYTSQAGDASPDHIGHEFGFLAHLSAAEADAWADGRDAIAQRLRLRQRDFLHGHLLRWLPALAQAIRDQAQPFYTALGELALELVQDHTLALPPSEMKASTHTLAAPSLNDEKTGLRQIARFLSAPTLSGIYLSRDTISAMARDVGVPRGFGGRQQMLENLFRAAVQYDSLDALLHALNVVVLRWQRAYRDAFVADLYPFMQPWQARTSATRALLEEMSVISREYGD